MKEELSERIKALFGSLAGTWRDAPNELLGGISPNAAVTAGNESEVEAIVDRLESGAYL